MEKLKLICELKVFIFHKITKYCQTTLGFIGNRGVMDGWMDGWMKWKPQIVHQVKVLFSAPAKKRTKDCRFHLWSWLGLTHGKIGM
jgi:hypothetical protein